MGNTRTSKIAVTFAAVLAVAAATGCSGGHNATSSSTASSTSSSTSAAASGTSSAVPSSGDYTGLLIKASDTGPDFINGGVPTINPVAGQVGVAQMFFTTRDGHRTIADRITVSDPATATAQTVTSSFAELGKDVPGVPDQPIDVGTNGRMVAGMSPNQSKAVTALVFAEGKAAVYLRFLSAPDDPIPPEFALDIARKQDAAVKNGLPS